MGGVVERVFADGSSRLRGAPACQPQTDANRVDRGRPTFEPCPADPGKPLPPCFCPSHPPASADTHSTSAGAISRGNARFQRRPESAVHSMTTSESQLEQKLIDQLTDLKYACRVNIRNRAALERNFREKFEALNRVRLTDGEFARLLDDIVTPDVFTAARTLRERNRFKAYATSDTILHIIESGHLTDLATNPVFSTKNFRAVPAKYRTLIPDYIKDCVSLNQFAA